jgi:hypothetical protein
MDRLIDTDNRMVVQYKTINQNGKNSYPQSMGSRRIKVRSIYYYGCGTFHILRLWNVKYYICGSFNILRLWNVPYDRLIDTDNRMVVQYKTINQNGKNSYPQSMGPRRKKVRSIYYGCGTFHILHLWNVPYITFVERSIYYVYGTFHILCLWNVPFLTPFSFHCQFPFTADLDPYGEEMITSSELFDLADYVKINTNHDYKNHRMNGWMVILQSIP